MKKDIRPVLVRFWSYKCRLLSFGNKKNLKRSKISIAEDLTQNRVQLLKEVKGKYKRRKFLTWTKNGNIFVKINDRILKVVGDDDLDQL